MELRTAIESLRKDLQRYADSGRANPRVVAFKQDVLNTIIGEFNRQEAFQMEVEAQEHRALLRAVAAERTIGLLFDWCYMHGVDPRVVYGLIEEDEAVGAWSEPRAMELFREARKVMMRFIIGNGNERELFTPGVERSRLAWYLLLKRASPAGTAKHDAFLQANATAAVKEPATA